MPEHNDEELTIIKQESTENQLETEQQHADSPTAISKIVEVDEGPEEVKEVVKEEVLTVFPDYRKLYYPNFEEPLIEDLKKCEHLVPEKVRAEWYRINSSQEKHMKFINSPAWSPYSKSKDGQTKLYIQAIGNCFCMKSISVARADIETLCMLAGDNALKVKYDETVESIELVHDYLPYDCSVGYQKFKKVLVVSPRDMVTIGKCFRITPKLTHCFGYSIDYDKFPPIKGVVRAESPISGWIFREIEEGDPSRGIKPLTEVTFYS